MGVETVLAFAERTFVCPNTPFFIRLGSIILIMSQSKHKPSDTKLLTVVVLAPPPLAPCRVNKIISRRIPSVQSTLDTVHDVLKEAVLNNARQRKKDESAAMSAFEEWWRGVSVWQGEGLLFVQATSETNVCNKCYILPKGTTSHDASLLIRSRMSELKSKKKNKKRRRDDELPRSKVRAANDAQAE